MFEHVGLNVRDCAASRSFYEQALAPLGYRFVRAFDEITAHSCWTQTEQRGGGLPRT